MTGKSQNATEGTTASLSVLHVDDDEGFAELVKTYLERDSSEFDCRITTETSPTDALETIRSGAEFDCVVSDYNMPEMNGISFLEAIRETYSELPLLLFSGEETGDVAAEILDVGLTDYIKKGFGTEQYTMLVRRVEHAVRSDGQFDPASEAELDGVGVVGVDDRIERADEKYASFYRYDADELVGKHWTELHPPDEVEHIKTHVLPVVQDGGKWTGQSRGKRADGSTFTESKLVTALDDRRLLIAVTELDDSDLASADRSR
ncbi:response regulator [Halogeometricum limi]|uniref:PAS domain S-box-containing protein n=1 Tax=Halogeometricum limi TaxID=555875 RepID=A0A1I6IA38_9EURY|nr:response regulator [Halogeometricum limi]SFR63622.1 PAS domain S-box-containing protein [Halogeometricum limi]